MRLLFLLSGVFMLLSHNVLAANSNGNAPSNDAQSVKVESFNLRFDNPNDGINAWPHRQQRVLNHLQQHQFDVVGMQEVLAHQLDWLTQHLPDYAAIGVGRDDGKRGGEFVPLLYNSKTLTLLDSGYFWLSDTPNVAGSIGWLAKLPRIVSWAKFSRNNSIFLVFNAHFSHVSDLARQKSAEFLVRYIPTIAADYPVILMGDLNTLDTDPAYSTIISDTKLKFVDSALVGKAQPASTFNGFGNATKHQRIDYIFISQGLSSSQYTTHEDREGERYISDHYPVSAVIEFSQ